LAENNEKRFDEGRMGIFSRKEIVAELSPWLMSCCFDMLHLMGFNNLPNTLSPFQHAFSMNKTHHQSDSLVIGIDGGGTKTIAWLASLSRGSLESDHVVLGKGAAGPSNQRAVGPVIAMSNLDSAIAAAFDSAELARQTVAAACLGLAGADRDSDRQVVENWADASRLAKSVTVVNDAIPLLNSGKGTGTGVALIAGTGSLAWGRNENGQTARSGGWGYLFSDEGSAFSIGRAVLNAVSRAVDGRSEQTRLVGDVFEHLKISAPQEIVAAVYSHEIPRSVVASTAFLAFSASAAGDKVAIEILQQAASELAGMAVSTTRRLTLQSALSLSITGAVLLQNAEFRQRVITEIEAADIELVQTILIEDAVSGAVNMAVRQARASTA
jgi:N-acetylglucosamine kinase-like BadF-type ATPase